MKAQLLFQKYCDKCENVMQYCPIDVHNEPLEFDKEVKCPLWMLYYGERSFLEEKLNEATYL